MLKSVKTLVFITFVTFSSLAGFAQIKLPFNGSLGNDVKKVIEDYPNRFNNLLGELIVKNPQSTDYRCNFTVAGAEEVSITQYTSVKNDVCSWQALMLTTDNFEKAKQRFRTLFNQLNFLPVKPGTTNAFHLKGKYETPTEEKGFTTIIFSVSPVADAVKKLKVELTMEYEQLEWKVRVLVYDREREDDERGKTVEE